MSSFTYENNGTNTYLVYEILKTDNVDSMSLGMITNNKIPGFAQTIFTQMDSTKFIKYNVSSRISLQSFFSGPVNKKRLLGVFKGIVDSFLYAEEYMLDNSSIVLDVEYIFVDVSTCDVSMICIPIIGKTRTNTEIGEFFRDLMYAIQSDETEDCSHVAKIMNYINSNTNFSLVEFKKVLTSLEGNAQSSQPSAVPAKPATTIPAPVAAPIPVAPVPQPVAAQPVAAPVQQVSAPVQPAKAPVVSQKPAQPVVPAKPAAPTKPAAPAAPMRAPNGMAVPPKPASKPGNTVPVEGQEISLFYLLQHYNSDNAAAYKAQKEAKKAAKGGSKPPKKQAAPAKPAPNVKAPAVPGQPVPAVPVPQPAVPVQPVSAPVAAPVAQPVPQPVPQPIPQPMPVSGANFGETTVLSGGVAGETTVLNQASASSAPQPNNPFLVRSKNHEVIQLNKYPFRIGKERSFVDYFIGDNTAISRSHAEITQKEGSYFVKDMNSTNHTFVNGTMIQSGVEVKLNAGDHLKLANEEFEFRLN